MNVVLIKIYIICLLTMTGLFMGMMAVMYGTRYIFKKEIKAGYCGQCNISYKWYQMIPVVSYIMMKGKCPHCHNKLSIWGPILEILGGCLCALAYLLYGLSYEMLIMILLTILLINIWVSDFKYLIILDKPLIISSLLVLSLKWIFFGCETFLISICSGLLIFIFMLIVRFCGDKIFGSESLGGGDIKLASFFGFVLGIRLSIVSLIVGSFLAFPYAVYSALLGKNKEIPFGPFLIMGLYIVFIFMEPINNFLTVIFR